MASPCTLSASVARALPTRSSRTIVSATRLRAAAAAFSTTTPQCRRKTKDNNKNRGVSALYGSGTRWRLSVSDMELPRPTDFKPTAEVRKDHGLWGFFPEPDKLMMSPAELEKYGRAWTVEELRKKSWEDLHSLWWVCCKERNMLHTSFAELKRSDIGFGEAELRSRDQEVQKTMRHIKHALTERQYTWQDAVQVAKTDEEIVQTEDGSLSYAPIEDAFEAEDFEDPQLGWEEVEKDIDVSAPEGTQKKTPEVTR